MSRPGVIVNAELGRNLPTHCNVCGDRFLAFSDSHSVVFINDWVSAKCACHPWDSVYEKATGRKLTKAEVAKANALHHGHQEVEPNE